MQTEKGVNGHLNSFRHFIISAFIVETWILLNNIWLLLIPNLFIINIYYLHTLITAKYYNKNLIDSY